MNTTSIQPKSQGNVSEAFKDDVKSDKVKQIPQVDIPSIGLGVMRTSSTIIAVLLQAEDNHSRKEILANMMKQFGFDPQDIAELYHDKSCSKCGISLYMHKKHGGCF